MHRIAVTLAVSLFSAPLLAQSAPVRPFQGLYDLEVLADPHHTPQPSGVRVWQGVPSLGFQAPADGTAAGGSGSTIFHFGGDAFQDQDAATPEPSPGDVWLGLALRQNKDGDAPLEVLEVLPDSPAGDGLRSGDRLVAVAGKHVARHADVLKALRGTREAQRVTLGIERMLDVELGASEDGQGRGFLGLHTEESSSDLPGGEGARGLSVAQVVPGSAAQSAGLRKGDRIAALGGQKVGSFKDLHAAISSRSPGEQVRLRVLREIHVELARRPGQGDRPGMDPRPGMPGMGAGPGADPRQPGQEGSPSAPRPGSGGNLWLRSPGEAAPRAGQAPGPDTFSPFAPRGEAVPRARRFSPAESSELLEEIRSLRREVADLRRELEALGTRRR